VRSPVDGGHLVQTAGAVWCEAEMIIPLGRELESFRQAVDCYALEKSSSGPLGKDLAVGCDALERSSSGPLGKDLMACSKISAAMDERSSSGPLGKDLLACSKKRAAGNASVQEIRVFRKLLDIFVEWLVWDCGHRSELGWSSSVGLKWRMRRNKSCLGLGWMRLRAGSSRVGCRPYSKKTTKSGLDPVRGFNAVSFCLWILINE